MCGFAGYLGVWSSDRPRQLRRAGEAIAHRGPDDAGLWCDESAGIGLVHRRLSILDLSRAGHQPMTSACGRYIIAFNGEIYNHGDLRRELDKAGAPDGLTVMPAWRGHADTETLLACLVRWGPAKTLPRLLGMFAFALWDAHERRLYLARDALGEKPLYYGRGPQGLFFGSELKALRQFEGFNTRVDRESLAYYLGSAAGCVPGSHAIYEDSAKLEPGTMLVVNAQERGAPAMGEKVPFWRLAEVIRHGQRNPLPFGSPGESADALESVLAEAVRSQMMADVPVGAFLSGGIDSSVVVALMQQTSARPVRTFSMGFDDARYDESAHARAIAAHLQTDHTEMIVETGSLRDVIPDLATVYCEPFADQSQIPTLMVARMAGEHVRVCLSGDGGDELFGGYRRYQEAIRLWGRRQSQPAFVRGVFAWLARMGTGQGGSPLISRLGTRLPGRVAGVLRHARVELLGRLLGASDFEAFYGLLLASSWPGGRRAVSPDLAAHEACGLTEVMMAIDTGHYLHDDILAKVDRAAMSVSLETRIPILDRRVVEFAWQLPASARLDPANPKPGLREILKRHVPAHLFERPKKGFGVPIDVWLRGPLKPWAEDLLHPDRLRREGFLDAGVVGKRWHEHLRGDENWQYDLWSVLMFQSWLDRQGEGAPGSRRERPAEILSPGVTTE